MELSLREVEIPPPVERGPSLVLKSGPEPVYAIVRQPEESSGQLIYQVSILGAGLKAAVVTAEKKVDRKEYDALLAKFDAAVGAGTGGGNVENLLPLGDEFGKLLLPRRDPGGASGHAGPALRARPRYAFVPYSLGGPHDRPLDRRGDLRAEPAAGGAGLLCANEVVLTGTDLSGIGNLPSLVFFNACEAG
jgi:hypothetical protein